MTLRDIVSLLAILSSASGQGVEHLTMLWNNAPGAPALCYTHSFSHKSWGDWADKKDLKWSWSRSERNITGEIVWADFMYSGAEKYPRTFIGRYPNSSLLLQDPTYHRCRPSTYMDPNRDYSISIFAISVAFLFYCVVQSKTHLYMAEFEAFSPKAVIMYTSLAQPYTSLVDGPKGPNPLPNTPLLMTAAYNSKKRYEDCKAGRNCKGGPYPEMYHPFPDQTCDFYGKGRFKGRVAGNNPWANFPASYYGPEGGPVGWWLDSGNGTVYAQLASYQTPSARELMSDVSMAFFKVWSALAFATVAFSAFVLAKLKRKALSWQGYVVFIEGIASSGCRGVQLLYEPVFANESTTYYMGNFIQLVDVPFSVSSTYVTFMIWAKLVITVLFRIEFSKPIKMAYDVIVGAGAIAIIPPLFIVIGGDWSYARRPWVPALLAKDGDLVRMDGNNLILALNIGFISAFGAVCFIGLASIMRAAQFSPALKKVIQTMFFYIGFQMVGTVLYIWAFYLNSHLLRHADYTKPGWVLFYNHAKFIGGLIMSMSQVMVVFSSAGSSGQSTSSSSSSTSGQTNLAMSVSDAKVHPQASASS